MANARRTKSAMAVVYLDLDGFKAINDTSGTVSAMHCSSRLRGASNRWCAKKTRSRASAAMSS